MYAGPDHPGTIRAQLLSEMKSGIYAQCDRLPPENILSERLGISRTQLRDALASLDREGFITRRHGVGTVINRHVLNVLTRMDIEVEFLDMIRQSGYEPAVAYVQIQEDEADQTVAGKLSVPEGTPVIRVCRLCTADGRPAIYCEDNIEKALVRGSYTAHDLKRPIFHFLEQFCGVSCYLDLTELHPIAAGTALAELLALPVGTPLLNMEEVDFDIDGKAVLYSREYFVDGLFHHTVMRKKF